MSPYRMILGSIALSLAALTVTSCRSISQMRTTGATGFLGLFLFITILAHAEVF